MGTPPPGRLRPRRRAAALCGAALAALALAACGSSDSAPVLDGKKIERAIERSSQAQRGLDATVSCPADVAIEKGMTFECIAVVDDVSTRFVVTQTDARGHVRYEAP
jgi:hypothetical protein